MRLCCRRNILLPIFVMAFCSLAFAQGNAAKELTAQQRLDIALEALSRLEKADFEKDPKVKTAVDRLLVLTQGKPEFVRIVKRFGITHQNEGLLQVAVNEPSSATASTASR